MSIKNVLIFSDVCLMEEVNSKSWNINPINVNVWLEIRLVWHFPLPRSQGPHLLSIVDLETNDTYVIAAMDSEEDSAACSTTSGPTCKVG